MSERRGSVRWAGQQMGRLGTRGPFTLCYENGIFQVGEQWVPIVMLITKEDQEPADRRCIYSQPTLCPTPQISDTGTFTQH